MSVVVGVTEHLLPCGRCAADEGSSSNLGGSTQVAESSCRAQPHIRRLSGNTNPPHQQQRQHNRIARAKEQRRVGGTYRRRSRSGLVRPASQFDPTLSMVNKLSTWHIRARLASPPAETEEKSA